MGNTVSGQVTYHFCILHDHWQEVKVKHSKELYRNCKSAHKAAEEMSQVLERPLVCIIYQTYRGQTSTVDAFICNKFTEDDD